MKHNQTGAKGLSRERISERDPLGPIWRAAKLGIANDEITTYWLWFAFTASTSAAFTMSGLSQLGNPWPRFSAVNTNAITIRR